MLILIILVTFVSLWAVPRISHWADRSAHMPWRDKPWLVDALVPKRVPDDEEEWAEVLEPLGGQETKAR